MNVDGLRLFDYPGTELWPILGRVVQPFLSQPFVLGCFSGYGKPDTVDDFLLPFVEDMQRCMSVGVVLDGDVNSQPIDLHSIICDTVARAFIRKVKCHTGYYGCDKCVQKGKYYPSRRMSFPRIRSQLRTDADFREQRYSEHHTGLSILTNLQINMVQQFPLDPMHLVFLGVVKRFLNQIFFGDRLSGYRLSRAQIRHLDALTKDLVNFMPVDFPRKCSSVEICDRWKANECRQFLLYIGPVAFKQILPRPLYETFLNLSCAISILSHACYHSQLVNVAQTLLERFILQFATLFGEDQIVYNVHCLSHLVDDVIHFGPLHSFSSFPFESFMSSIKKDIKGRKHPEVQLRNRAHERSTNLNIATVSLVDDTFISRTNNATRGMFLFRETCYISASSPDNCILANNTVYLVRSITKQVAWCKRFLSTTDLYDHEIPSSVLNIYIARTLSEDLQPVPFSSIYCKCVCFPTDFGHVIIPVLHSIKPT